MTDDATDPRVASIVRELRRLSPSHREDVYRELNRMRDPRLVIAGILEEITRRNGLRTHDAAITMALSYIDPEDGDGKGWMPEAALIRAVADLEIACGEWQRRALGRTLGGRQAAVWPSPTGRRPDDYHRMVESMAGHEAVPFREPTPLADAYEETLRTMRHHGLSIDPQAVARLEETWRRHYPGVRRTVHYMHADWPNVPEQPVACGLRVRELSTDAASSGATDVTCARCLEWLLARDLAAADGAAPRTGADGHPDEQPEAREQRQDRVD